MYWDNSNIYHEAQRIAEEREGTPGARYLVRIKFDGLLNLALAGRPLEKSGSSWVCASRDAVAMEQA